MLDGIKTFTPLINFKELKQRIHTPFESKINTDTGELVPQYEKYNKQTFSHFAKVGAYNFKVKECVHGKRRNYHLLVTGSLHQNHFNGSNHKDFTFSNTKEQIELLSQLTGIYAKDMNIQNLEFGVNLKTSFTPIDYLSDNLIVNKGAPFNKYAPDKTNISIGYVHQLYQYHKKLYDKGLQYELDTNLMRYELAYKKMEQLNKRGIYNLEQLTNANILIELEQLLITKWNEILINDTLTKPNIKKRDKLFLKEANNPKFWANIKTDNNYREQRRKFKKLQGKHCTGTQNLIKEQIRDKWNYLSAH